VSILDETSKLGAGNPFLVATIATTATTTTTTTKDTVATTTFSGTTSTAVRTPEDIRR
jgi:hypothetical protein